MLPLSCPVPANINPLQSNGFMFSIQKLPDVKFFAQEVNLPGLGLPTADIDNPFAKTPLPGDKLDFADLDITFLVDESMNNYTAIYNWMVALGFPQMRSQYTTYMNQDPINLYSELAKNYSDGTLQILNSSNQPVKTILFRDIVPVSLGSIVLQSTSSDTQYVAGQATFRYTYYEFVTT